MRAGLQQRAYKGRRGNSAAACMPRTPATIRLPCSVMPAGRTIFDPLMHRSALGSEHVFIHPSHAPAGRQADAHWRRTKQILAERCAHLQSTAHQKASRQLAEARPTGRLAVAQVGRQVRKRAGPPSRRSPPIWLGGGRRHQACKLNRLFQLPASRGPAMPDLAVSIPVCVYAAGCKGSP